MGFGRCGSFLFFFVVAISANIIANSRPLLVSYKGDLYTPFLATYSEKNFGGDFETEADYRDPYVQELINRLAG